MPFVLTKMTSHRTGCERERERWKGKDEERMAGHKCVRENFFGFSKKLQQVREDEIKDRMTEEG